MAHPTQAAGVAVALPESQTQITEATIEPLPGGCIDGTPAGEDELVCCISGFVIVNGQPVAGAEVAIADAQGGLITVTTQVYEGRDPTPRYAVDLSHLVSPTTVITLVARYGGLTSAPIRHVVLPGGQHENFAIADLNALGFVGQTPGWAAPGKFDQARHVATDSQGNVYVIDWLNTRIQVFSPDGVFLRTWGELGNEKDQFSPRGMSGIAIDPRTDTVYVGNSSKYEIKKFTTDGDFLGAWQHWTLALISDIQVDGNGNVYVLAHRGGLFKFDADGRWLRWPAWPNDLAYIWSNVVRLAITPDGDAYSYLANTLYRFDAGVPQTITTQLLDGVPLSTIYSIASDADGYLYVAERPSGTRIIKLAARPNNVLEQVPWDWQPSPTDTMRYFNSMTIHADNLYITGDLVHRVWQFGLDGKYRRGWGELANNPEQISDPRGLAISPVDNALYMADCKTQHINKVVGDIIIRSWNADELAIPEPNAGWCAVGLAFDPTGTFLWAVSGQRLERFIVNGDQIRFDKMWGTYGAGSDQFAQPNALAVDRNGIIYIADTANNRVKVVKLAADTIQPIAILTEIAPGKPITRPYGIAVDDTDPLAVTVYVAEIGNCTSQTGRLLKFTFVNDTIQNIVPWGSQGWGDPTGSFICPSGVYVRDRNLYATINYQTSNAFYVYKIDPAGELQDAYGGTPGWGPGQFLNPLAVAVNGQGEMWVSDTNNSRLQRFKTKVEDGKPVATIVRLSSAELTLADTLSAIGAGQDSDATNQIIAYQWSSDLGLSLTTNAPTVLIPTIASATTAGALGPGVHRLQLRVQDDEGEWSAPDTALIFVDEQVTTPACPVGNLWTFLLYLDADYNDGGQLFNTYLRAFAALDTLNHPCVQVFMQLDGHAGATRRFYKEPGAKFNEIAEFQSEVQMDTMDALRDFTTAGQTKLPADHYYLAIADHGDGARGIAWDHTSAADDSAYLTADEIRQALASPGVLPVDILHLDACSMALLDVAYQIRGKVKYLIAAQYLGWDFFAYADYARAVGDHPQPKALAQQIVNRYAALAESYQAPYTLAALDLQRIEPVKNGLDALALLLKAWVRNDDQSQARRQQLAAIRASSQFFDSNGNFTNSPIDNYVDLQDWLTKLHASAINPEITNHAQRLIAELQRTTENEGVILVNRVQNGYLPARYGVSSEIVLSGAHGLSIYYPVEGEPRATFLATAAADNQTPLLASGNFTYTQIYADYLAHKQFDLTRVSRWDEFLQATYGAPAPNTPLEPSLPPAAPLDVPKVVYLPVVMR